MIVADPDYRTDPSRAIYVLEEFTDALVRDLLPKIFELRREPSKPITVYINSRGGSIQSFETLTGALSSLDQSGDGNRIITVAIGDAGSAAANLLALGDYSIGYSHSTIHFHGMRYSEVPEVTFENASSFALHIGARNRESAQRLAEKVIGRLVDRHLLLRRDYDAHRKDVKSPDLSDIECFVDGIFSRVSGAGDHVLDRALTKYKSAMSLIERVFKKIPPAMGLQRIQQDATVLKAVIDYEVEIAEEGIRLDEFGIGRVNADYFLLRDYFFGQHLSFYERIKNTHGIYFLKDRYDEYKELRTRDRLAAAKLLEDVVGDSIKRFWYFTVLLCRELQAGENRLSASDAYWLGILDEVIGTDLTGERAVMEEEPDVPAEVP